ncbi:hypothetical protein D3C87_1792110 [compost metagenome]
MSSHTSSSVVSHPMPWMNPPSICPISTAGFSDLPTSCRISTRSTVYSPVSVSMVTSLTEAP